MLISYTTDIFHLCLDQINTNDRYIEKICCQIGAITPKQSFFTMVIPCSQAKQTTNFNSRRTCPDFSTCSEIAQVELNKTVHYSEGGTASIEIEVKLVIWVRCSCSTSIVFKITSSITCTIGRILTTDS